MSERGTTRVTGSQSEWRRVTWGESERVPTAERVTQLAVFVSAHAKEACLATTPHWLPNGPDPGAALRKSGFQVSKVLQLREIVSQCMVTKVRSTVTLSVKSVPIATPEPDLWSRRVVKEHVKETRTRLGLNTRTRSCPWLCSTPKHELTQSEKY